MEYYPQNDWLGEWYSVINKLKNFPPLIR
jgi:hypothetical protein